MFAMLPELSGRKVPDIGCGLGEDNICDIPALKNSFEIRT